MAKLSDLECAKGLGGGPAKKVAGSGRSGHRTRQATNKALQSELLQPSSVLEGVMAGEEDAAVPADPKICDDRGGERQAAVPSEGGPGCNPVGKDSSHLQLGQVWPWGAVGQATA